MEKMKYKSCSFFGHRKIEARGRLRQKAREVKDNIV